jgi:nucleotidyltransferase substrate binding protein (TIGR01987 family)
MNDKSKTLLTQWEKATARLEEVLALPKNPVVRDSCVQRFEFTFELGWKVLKGLLREEGLEGNSPRECIRLAFKQGWIENDARWLEALTLRNLTSHTYEEAVAEKIYKDLPAVLDLFKTTLQKLKTLE